VTSRLGVVPAGIIATARTRSDEPIMPVLFNELVSRLGLQIGLVVHSGLLVFVIEEPQDDIAPEALHAEAANGIEFPGAFHGLSARPEKLSDLFGRHNRRQSIIRLEAHSGSIHRLALKA
jgi:hypothetical protein